MSKMIEVLRTLYPHIVQVDFEKRREVKKWLKDNHIKDYEIFYFERDGTTIMAVGFETEESHFFTTLRYFKS